MNEDRNLTRRSFMTSIGMTAAASSVLKVPAWGAAAGRTGGARRPALLGGTPVRTKDWPGWPQEGPADEEIMKKALQEKRWCYLRQGAHFCRDYEQELSRDYGARVILTNAGTNALHTCLYVLDVGPGDEVLTPGDSFIASMQAILNLFALPIFIDVDPTTGLVDPALIERAITPHTKAIMPVHLFGASCDMDAIMPIATKHGLKVVEDACQSPYVEWDGRKLGTIGDCGAISFNVWKTLGCGEGGAIVASNDEVARACDAFRNNGRTTGKGGGGFMGMNYRPTEFQAALLLTQAARYREQAPIRRRNAAYLSQGLAQIPGLDPLRVYPKTTHHNYYNYHVRYDAGSMGGLPIDRFTSAMRAEGIPCGSHPDSEIMSHHDSLDRLLRSRHFQKCYSREQLERCEASRPCPQALHLARNVVQFSQALLLGSQADMDDILEAARKIQHNASALIKS